MAKQILAALTLVLFTAGFQPANAFSFISRAAFAEGRLWLLSEDGKLSSLAEHDTKQEASGFDLPVLDIFVQRNELIAITCATSSCTDWTVHRHLNGHWDTESVVPSEGDELLAVSGDNDSIVLLSRHNIVSVTSSGQRATHLDYPLDRTPSIGKPTAALITSSELLVGFNGGEWGGGLFRIDRENGIVKNAEDVSLKADRLATKDTSPPGPVTASTPQEPFLDAANINGITIEPWKPQCLAVSEGLVHFFASGGVIELCGNKAKYLYVKPIGAKRMANGVPVESMPFYGITSEDGQLLAAGLDGIYRIAHDGSISSVPLPSFETIDNVSVSFELKGIVLVLTDTSRHQAISPSVPMLIPR